MTEVQKNDNLFIFFTHADSWIETPIGTSASCAAKTGVCELSCPFGPVHALETNVTTDLF